MSKPKLLITMGCSFTEGVGCWDENTFPPEIVDDYKIFAENYGELLKYPIRNSSPDRYLAKLSKEISNKLFRDNRENFHNKGWPMKLGKLLNVDEVKNLGRGGGSISGQVKTFFEKEIHKESYEEYDVLVVWLFSYPSRISFYVNGRVEDMNYNDPAGLYEHYHRLITYDNTDNQKPKGFLPDAQLEGLFYFRIIEAICEKNNWSFLAFSHTPEDTTFIKELESSKNFIDNRVLPNPRTQTNLYSPLCNHVNEEGYQYTANKMYHIVKTMYSSFQGINTNLPNMEYIGESVDWYDRYFLNNKMDIQPTRRARK